MDQAATRSGSIGLREFIRVIRRRKWTIVAFAAVLVAGSVGYDYWKTPEYTATAQVQLTPQISSAVLEANNSSLLSSATPVDVPTDIQVIESNLVARKVQQHVKNAPGVTVTQVGITDVVDISVTSIDPHLAARAANTYASTFIQVQQSQAIASLASASQAIQQHIDSLQNQINAVQAQLPNVSSNSQQQSSLLTELTGLEQSQEALRSQISIYQTAASLATGGGQVVSQATVPNRPSAPKPIEYAFIALIVGLILGIVLASLQEYLDEKIRSVEELEEMIGTTPVIGLVPEVAKWKEGGTPYLVSNAEPTSPAAEAYRSLRTSVQFLGLDQHFRTLLLTSPRSSEGKTTTLANLAITIAESGKRVVVVDCDLRRPRLHSFFSLANSIGFTSVLVGETTVEESIFDVPGQPNLRVMPSGVIPPNPSELLSSRQAHETFATLAAKHDLVLIDSPPVLPVTDAVVLGPRMDAVIVVASAGTTTRHDMSRALETLRRVEAPVAGVVWNRAFGGDVYADYRYSYPASQDGIRSDLGDSLNGNGRRRAHARVGNPRRTVIG